MIHRIVRKSPHLTYPFHLMHEIRYISGSFSLLCATLFASVCVPAWAKTGHVTKPTTAKVVSVKNQKVLAGKNNPVKNQKNQDADISRATARQNKRKDADKKTTTPVQLARMDKSGKPNPAKHHARLAKNDTRPAKSGSIARNEKFTDSVKQSAGKADKHENSEKGLSVRDLQKQIATLQTSGKKRLLTKAQKQQLTQLMAQLHHAENTAKHEKMVQARMQRPAVAKPGKQQEDTSGTRQQYLQALIREAQSKGSSQISEPVTITTTGIQQERADLQIVRHENSSDAPPVTAPAATSAIAPPSPMIKEEEPAVRSLASVTDRQSIAPKPAVAFATTTTTTESPSAVRRIETAPSPIVRVSIPQRDGLGQIRGLSEDRAGFGPELHSNVAFVMDQNTGQVLVNKNGHNISPIASITKLMTAVITMDANLPMDEMITITEEDVDRLKGSRSRLAVGTTLSRQELLHLALMSSENRAAHALGRSYPGGLSEAIRAMNMRALMLGMRETRYVEPTGLSSANRSSAHDLALLVKAAYRYPLIRNYTTYPGAEFPVQGQMMRFNNTNRLIHSPDWNIGLQKTGYISEAGRCVVMQSNISGRNVIIVLLDSAGTSRRVEDAEAIRYWVQQDTRPAPARDGSSIVARGMY